MIQELRCAVAEFIGTFALVFVGAGSMCASPAIGAGPTPLIIVALAHGLILSVMISATMHVSSGQFNPAISLSLWAGGKQSLNQTIVNIFAQLIGAVLASFFLYLIFSQFGTPDFVDSVKNKVFELGTPLLNTDPQLGMKARTGLLVESILSFFLVTVFWGTRVDGHGATPVAGLAIGGTVAAGILMGGPLTGASMNPARSFGPALVSGQWSEHWVYWVGPILGGVAAAWVYKIVLLREKSGDHPSVQ